MEIPTFTIEEIDALNKQPLSLIAGEDQPMSPQDESHKTVETVEQNQPKSPHDESR